MSRYEVTWTPTEEGGRRRPALPGYACTTVIDGQHWSVVWDGKSLYALMDGAPPLPDELELFEGSRVVARARRVT